MAYYPATPVLGLLKAEPGTNQPFETAVFNNNYDQLESNAVLVDGRLDVVEGRLGVTVFVQSAEPTAKAVGDLWFW